MVVCNWAKLTFWKKKDFKKACQPYQLQMIMPGIFSSRDASVEIMTLMKKDYVHHTIDIILFGKIYNFPFS